MAWNAPQQHLLLLCTMWQCQHSSIMDAEQVMLLPRIRLSVTVISGSEGIMLVEVQLMWKYQMIEVLRELLPICCGVQSLSVLSTDVQDQYMVHRYVQCDAHTCNVVLWKTVSLWKFPVPYCVQARQWYMYDSSQFSHTNLCRYNAIHTCNVSVLKHKFC